MITVIGCQVGEPAFGVSPGDGVVHLTSRAALEEEMWQVVDLVEAKGAELAEKYGLKVGYEHQTAFPETRAHPESVEKVRAACAAAGVPVLEMPEPSRGGEDFGHYTKLIPGAMFFIGAGDGPAVHTHEYDFDDDLIEPAVEIFKQLAGTPNAGA